MTALSITFRPKDYDAVNGIKEFRDFIKTFSTRWYIGCEMGLNGVNPNHLQCYIETDKRYDKVRQRLIDRFELTDPLHSLVVRRLHDDGRVYNLGYCQKERLYFKTNIPQDELDIALKEWTEKHDEYEAKNTRKKGKKLTFDVDTVFADILEMHSKRGEKEFNSVIYNEYMGNMLLVKKNYSLFSRINDFKFHEAIDLALESLRKK